MKFLQITKDGVEITPKILEMGVDFDIIWEGGLWKTHGTPFCVDTINDKSEEDSPSPIEKILSHNNYSGDFATLIANISDCYKQRPLVEIDGFYEFDVVKNASCSKGCETLGILIFKNGSLVSIEFYIKDNCAIKPFEEFSDDTDGFTNYNYYKNYDNLSSVFLPQNQPYQNFIKKQLK